VNWIRRRWNRLTAAEQRYVLILAALALAVRLVYAFSVDLIPADYMGIDLDAVEYDYLGVNVAEGKGLVDRFGFPTSFRFPAYPFLLGFIYFLFGHSHMAVLVIQAFMGVATPLLIYFTARHLLPETTSRIAGAVGAIYPGFVYFVGWLMTENLFLLLISLLLYYTVSLGRVASWRKLVFLGVLLGLLGLTRGVGLPFLGLIPAYIFLRHRGDFRTRLVRSGAVMAVGCLTLLPWTVRNYLQFDRLMLPSAEGGVVLWLGFNDVPLIHYQTDAAFEYVERVGREHARSEEFYRLLADHNLFGITAMKELFRLYYPDEPPPQSEVEASDRLGAKAQVLLFQSPMAWVYKSIKQVFRFWHVLDERGRYVYGYGFIIPFFFAGAWLQRRRVMDFMPLYLYPAVLYAVAIVFFADARFRLPFEGVLIIVGAWGIERFLARFKPVYWGYGILAVFFLANYYLRLHSPQVRLAIRSVAGALGFQMAEI